MKCECPYKEPHPCVQERAVWVVDRGGKKLRLCTRCKLSKDEFVARLYDVTDIQELSALDANPDVEPNTQADLISGVFDAMGGMAALLSLQLGLPREEA